MKKTNLYVFMGVVLVLILCASCSLNNNSESVDPTGQLIETPNRETAGNGVYTEENIIAVLEEQGSIYMGGIDFSYYGMFSNITDLKIETEGIDEISVTFKAEINDSLYYGTSSYYYEVPADIKAVLSIQNEELKFKEASYIGKPPISYPTNTFDYFNSDYIYENIKEVIIYLPQILFMGDKYRDKIPETYTNAEAWATNSYTYIDEAGNRTSIGLGGTKVTVPMTKDVITDIEIINKSYDRETPLRKQILIRITFSNNVVVELESMAEYKKGVWEITNLDKENNVFDQFKVVDLHSLLNGATYVEIEQYVWDNQNDLRY